MYVCLQFGTLYVLVTSFFLLNIGKKLKWRQRVRHSCHPLRINILLEIRQAGILKSA